jgi:hypothetical protein
VTSAPPLCPDCGQPASRSLGGDFDGWECRNEACAEFGQHLQAAEPPPRDPPDPGDDAAGRRP